MSPTLIRQPTLPPAYVVCLPNAFDEGECLRLRDLLDLNRTEEGQVKSGLRPAIRRSALAWVPETVGWEWVERRMVTLLADANREVFGFDLSGFEERLQVARYEARRRGGFDWHGDRARTGLAARRKLSLSVQLSEGAEYKGGHLELFADGHKWRAPRKRGTAIFFASFLPHRVAPVSEGVRHSLVAWAHGPDFR